MLAQRNTEFPLSVGCGPVHSRRVQFGEIPGRDALSRLLVRTTKEMQPVDSWSIPVIPPKAMLRCATDRMGLVRGLQHCQLSSKKMLRALH